MPQPPVEVDDIIRAAAGFGWCEAGAFEVFGAEFDMSAEFGFDVGFDR